MKLNKMREEMIQSFIDCLKKDTIPWHRSWSANERPFNAVTNTAYHGANSLWLSYNQFERNFEDPRWCTFKQAQSKGWKIKSGAKGTKIEFWSLYDTEEKRKLTRTEAKQLTDELTAEEFKNRVKPMSNTYTVFNAEQIEGIPKYIVETYNLNTEELMQRRDTLIKNMGVGFREGGDKAYYAGTNDQIVLPEINRFESEYDYMETLLHEAGHATGHVSRLNRDLTGAFGSPEYAREELRAEIASAFTAQAVGIDYQQNQYMENHEAYVQDWISVLENNPNELFAAIKDAEKISDYLIEKGEFNKEYTEDKNLMSEMESYVAMHRNWIEELPQKKIPIVINAYGGPGAGKSVACLDVCSALKKAGYTAEYVQEYAKELVYDKNMEMLNGTAKNQFAILKEQTRRIDRLYDQVDFIVTDSPIMLNSIYNKELTQEYGFEVNQLSEAYVNFSVFIERDASSFEEEGRIHNLNESIEKDNEIKSMLDEYEIRYKSYTHNTVKQITEDAIKEFAIYNPELHFINSKLSNLQIQKKTDENYVRDSKNIQLSNAQAARFRMGMKGHERSFNEFINDEDIPRQLRADAVSIGQAVNDYVEKGDSIENIVTHAVGKIDKEVNIGDTAYTKNLICSLYSTTKDEYNALKELPDLWNKGDLIEISDKLAQKLISRQVKPVLVANDIGMIIDTNTPKELEHFNQHKGLLINENLLNGALAKHPELTPVVKCEWSEANEFNPGQIYTLKEYDEMMQNADTIFSGERERIKSQYKSDEDFYNTSNQEHIKYTLYEKNKYTLDFGDGRKVTERQSIGKNEGGLMEHFNKVESLKVYTDEMEKSISLEDEFDLRQKKIKAVYDYEEENNIPEDFRTTSAEMEVISNEMLDKQYSLIEKGMNNVKPEKNPVVDYMKKNLNKNMLKGRELEL